MFEWYKKLDDKLKRYLSNVNLFNKYPNYFISKIPFQIAAALIVFFTVCAWVMTGFSITNVYISCSPTSASPCHNPVYVCPQEFINNNSVLTFNMTYYYKGVRCNNMPSWVCEQVPCNISHLQPGEHYGRESTIGRFIIVDVFLILWAFLINHILYRYKKKVQDDN